MHFPQKLCQNPLIPREHFDFDKTAFLSRKTNLSTISASSAEYSLSAHKERNWLQRGTSLIVEAGFLARGWGSLAGPPPPPPRSYTPCPCGSWGGPLSSIVQRCRVRRIPTQGKPRRCCSPLRHLRASSHWDGMQQQPGADPAPLRGCLSPSPARFLSPGTPRALCTHTGGWL